MLLTEKYKISPEEERILSILGEVCDPEVPVLTILDLGIVREIKAGKEHLEIFISPTYSGCPAMDMIAMDIRMRLLSEGYKNIEIKQVLSPAWTTEWMSEEGKKKLVEYGIAAPHKSVYLEKLEQAGMEITVQCPRCQSMNTMMISQFGSTACKSLYQCSDCREPFDYFKCH